MAKAPAKTFANASFYNNLMLFSGVLAAMCQYMVLGRDYGPRSILIIIPLLAAFAVPVFVTVFRRNLVNSGAPLFSLSRTPGHIWTDFGNAVASTGMFSVFTFVVASKEPFFDDKFQASYPLLFMMGNAVLFIITTYLYSMFAKAERKEFK